MDVYIHLTVVGVGTRRRSCFKQETEECMQHMQCVSIVVTYYRIATCTYRQLLQFYVYIACPK